MSFVAFGNDDLARQPRAAAGSVIHGGHCGGEHALEGTTTADGKTGVLLVYRCGASMYLAAVDGVLVVGLFPRWREGNP